VSALSVAYHVNSTQGTPLTGLRLSRGTLAQIYAGAITHWNDAAIQAENAAVAAWLPARPIKVVALQDSDITTLFTKALKAFDNTWPDAAVGPSVTAAWPAAPAYTAAHSDDVVPWIQANADSIGYAALSNTASTPVAIAALVNRAGVPVHPNATTIERAVWEAIEQNGFPLAVTDLSGPLSYPITFYVSVLFRADISAPSCASAQESYDCLEWVLNSTMASTVLSTSFPSGSFVELPTLLRGMAIQAVDMADCLVVQVPVSSSSSSSTAASSSSSGATGNLNAGSSSSTSESGLVGTESEDGTDFPFYVVLVIVAVVAAITGIVLYCCCCRNRNDDKYLIDDEAAADAVAAAEAAKKAAKASAAKKKADAAAAAAADTRPSAEHPKENDK
jgi:ABC-type phosphate transport system substrate-binding protein